MIIVIIAGGSGTRLWPLSQPEYPKHLLRLTGDNSLLQNTYQRAKAVTKQIFIATEVSHAEAVKEQLPELASEDFIIEPARRGTASVIVLALAYLQRFHPNETVVFLHADHHITDTAKFTQAVKAAAKASEQAQKIALIGLVPSYPATGFGYIKAGAEELSAAGLSARAAAGFKEKPDFATAERYIKEGNYYWNLGLFAAPISVFAANLKQFAPKLYQDYLDLCAVTSFDDATAVYLKMASQPIDTALIEKTDQILVIPGEFDWADIGSFLDLHKILHGQDSNALKGDVHQLDCTDSMIHAADKPIIAVGLEGIVVIDTPEGLLVCAKEQSQKVGELVKQYYAGKKAT